MRVYLEPETHKTKAHNYLLGEVDLINQQCVHQALCAYCDYMYMYVSHVMLWPTLS